MNTIGSSDPVAQQARLDAVSAAIASIGDNRKAFERLARLVSNLFELPYAGVSLVEQSSALVLAAVGTPGVIGRQPGTMCRLSVRSGRLFEVPDTHSDARFVEDPLVGGPARARYYVTVPFTDFAGQLIGTVWAADTRPRKLPLDRLSTLERLAGDASELVSLCAASTVDLPTGLCDQTYLTELARLEMSWCASEKRPVTICAIGIDGLADLVACDPSVADHAAKAVAAAMTDSVFRVADVAARLDDGSFGLLLSGSDEDGCQIVCARMMDSIDGLAMQHPALPNGRLTVSIGTSSTRTPVDPAAFLADAVRALGEAVDDGGDLHVGSVFAA